MNLKMPEIFIDPIFKSTKKHRLFKGRRASAKSESIARGVLAKVVSNDRTDAVCNLFNMGLFTRIITENNLEGVFLITDSLIRCRKNGNIIVFSNYSKKDVAVDTPRLIWFDNAETITKDVFKHFEKLAHSSCIFFYSYNSDSEPCYLSEHFEDDPDAEFTEVDYTDNPFCPQSLIAEAEWCKKNDIDKYNQIWHDASKPRKLNWTGIGDPLLKITPEIKDRLIKSLDGIIVNKEFTGKDIATAPDGIYQMFWNDGSTRKYGCKNYNILSFFGTQFCVELDSPEANCIEKMILIMEGT